MALSLRFAFVCKKQWQELTGNDPVRRHCDTCEREIVNLDPLTEKERETVFREAIRTGTKPCVFATIAVEHATPCTAPSPEEACPVEPYPMLGGEPEIDEGFFGDLEDDSDGGPTSS